MLTDCAFVPRESESYGVVCATGRYRWCARYDASGLERACRRTSLFFVPAVTVATVLIWRGGRLSLFLAEYCGDGVGENEVVHASAPI